MCPVPSSSSARRRAARLAAVAALLAAGGTGCKVDADVRIEAENDGSGRVTATVTLDEAAAKEVGSLTEDVRVDDLRDAGWTVTSEDRTITATKAFENPDEASSIVQEVAGPLVRRARVNRDSGFAKTTTDIDIELDLTAGLAGFSDSSVDEQLGGLPPGVSPEDVTVSLGAKAPGEGTVTADVSVGEKASVTTTGTDWHVTRVVAAVAAPLLAVAAAAIAYLRRTVPAPVTPDP